MVVGLVSIQHSLVMRIAHDSCVPLVSSMAAVILKNYFTLYNNTLPRHIDITKLMINNYLPPASVFAAHGDGIQAIYLY